MILNPEKHLKDAKQRFYNYIEEDVVLWLNERRIKVKSDEIEFIYGDQKHFVSHRYADGYFAEYSTKGWNKVQEDELSDEGLKVFKKSGGLVWPNVWYAVRLKEIDEILPLESGAIEEAILSGGIPEKYRVKH
ncbi:MAG: hypothetical protein FJ264_07220 [Planctomycetes bacterium]|nr:hypothetical protein [Planctomycetota bacterium]